VKSFRDADFKMLFARLPAHVQAQAVRAFHLWRADPWHLSLHFKEMPRGSGRYSVRVGRGYRALGTRDGDEIVWTWIGSHEVYNKL